MSDGERMLVEVYRSPRREEMYLFVERRAGLEHVPEALLERFGEPEPALSLLLTPERPLARADAARVMASIREHGYYLQMPPPPEDWRPGPPEGER